MDAFVEERLSEYLDGTLSDKERAVVEAHLAESERARASLESLRYTVNLLKQTPAPALPRQFTLPVTVRAPARSTPTWLVWSLRGVAVGAAAAFVILLTATLVRLPSSGQSAGAPPAAVIALAPTQTSMPFSSAAPANDSNATGPTMITEAPQPTAAAQAFPVTETPAASRKAQAAPTIFPQQRSQPAPAQPTEVNEPTNAAPTATVVMPEMSAAGSAAAQTTPAPETTNTDDSLQATSTRRTVNGVVITDQLRVRRGPGLGFRSIGLLVAGETVSVVGRSADDTWLVIQYPKNTDTGLGWVGAIFVKLDEPSFTLPVLEAPPASRIDKTVTPETPPATVTP